MLTLADMINFVVGIDRSDRAAIEDALNWANKSSDDQRILPTRRVIWRAVAKLLQSELERF